MSRSRGIGTFTIRMAEKAKVTAFDNDKLSISALKKAINHTQGLKPIITNERNLSTEPLFPQELKKFDTVVFDPPRSGAKNQVQHLVASDVKRIIAVSCNPTSFASDASEAKLVGLQDTAIILLTSDATKC